VQPFEILDGLGSMASDERLFELSWRLKAQGYRDRAAENLKLAENAQTPNVRER